MVSARVSKVPASWSLNVDAREGANRSVIDTLLDRYPPRVVPSSWKTTELGRAAALKRVEALMIRAQGSESFQRDAARGAGQLLRWLNSFPGKSWQDRWNHSGVAEHGLGWVSIPEMWLDEQGVKSVRPTVLTHALIGLFVADLIRPHLRFVVQLHRSHYWRDWAAISRDPKGFERLETAAGAETAQAMQGRTARWQISMLILSKGGGLSDITVGDCVELRQAGLAVCSRGKTRYLFYKLLHDIGIFPPDAPPTLRFVTVYRGQSTVAELVDRFDIANADVRNLLVDYLSERHPSLDYTTLDNLSRHLALHFWKNLETTHPGINSLQLDRSVAQAWKERMRWKVSRRRLPDGTYAEIRSPRMNYTDMLTAVRAFYLDLAAWAALDPARWARWVVPCPIGPGETSAKKIGRRRKARMYQRTRERLPRLPELVRIAEQRAHDAKMLLEAAVAASPGSKFTVLGKTYTKSDPWLKASADGIPVIYDSEGRTIRLREAENRAFWALATVEVLRHTGVRIEEMLEISHHSITQYRLPTTGELIPLLQIAPSKTDEERLLVVSPDLADMLSTIVSRIRGADGGVPLVPLYDRNERIWVAPAPLLFQWKSGGHHRAVSAGLIRNALTELIDAAGVKDAAGEPLYFQPHDLRRIFATDAIMNGMPPHIAQVLLGHKDINTTMGYKALYPEEAINGHRAFISRRRALRPSEEYRTPTDAEWDEFLGHFERRKLALGECGRAYGTSCQHEHSCIRCPVLRVDPAQRFRLVEIRDNLAARITEADSEGWIGEAEGLRVSLMATEEKLDHIDRRARRAVQLNMPSFPNIVAHTVQPPA